MFSVKVLGCGSAAPAKSRWPSSQVVTIGNTLLLLDCGEGTQFLLRRYKVKFQRIQAIFITHLHGDHFFGLPGLLSTMGLLGRAKKLTIYGPVGLKHRLDAFLGKEHHISGYELEVLELQDDMQLEIGDARVTCIPLKHRISTHGFVISEKPKLRNLITEKIADLDIPKFAYLPLKQGKDVETDKGILRSEELTFPPEPVKSYAYCTDTMYSEQVERAVSNVDLLYHEATFLHELEETAHATGHSTALEAARLASNAQVGKLMLGHYSARYADPEPLLLEAKTVFDNSILAEEGLEITL